LFLKKVCQLLTKGREGTAHDGMDLINDRLVCLIQAFAFSATFIDGFWPDSFFGGESQQDSPISASGISLR
jgi:hypothetical protein